MGNTIIERKEWRPTHNVFTIRNVRTFGKPKDWEQLERTFKDRSWNRRCLLEIQRCNLDMHKIQGTYRLLWNDCDDEYFEFFTYDIVEAREIFDFMTSLDDWQDVRDCFIIFGFWHC